QFSYLAATADVTSLSTSSGRGGGGTRVVITGHGFSGVYAVSFGDTPATDFTILSDTTLVVTAPPHTAGTFDITLTAVNATFAPTAAARFTYTTAAAPAITVLSPASGSTAGGSRVVLTGSGFSGAGSVSFGGVPASFEVDSDSQITAIAPPGSAGVVDVQV